MKMPNILTPVKTLDGAVQVIEAGADELYCAVTVPNAVHVLNRPEECCVQSYGELSKITAYARAHGIPTIATLELPFVAEFMAEQMEEHVYSLVDAGVEALIVGDVGQIQMVRRMGLDVPLHASTFLGAMNPEAVAWLRDMGVVRVVLERHVTLPEISEMVARADGVEIEVFAFGGGCSNINSNCYLTGKLVLYAEEADAAKVQEEMKGVWKPCRFPYEVYDYHTGRYLARAPIMDGYAFCPLCDLPELVLSGVDGLKIVDRCRPLAHQLAATHMLRALTDLIVGDGLPFDEAKRARFGELLEEYKDVVIELTHPAPGSRMPPTPLRLRELACKDKRCYFVPLLHRPYALQGTPERVERP